MSSQNYKIINPKELKENVFKLLEDKWMLITAAKKSGAYNTMTASWGGMGIMWNKPVSWCVIRPQRYTYGFMEEADYYTLSFFPEEYRKALNILGTKSGRNGDKIKESGLTPYEYYEIDKGLDDIINKRIFFEEADITLICKKLYYQDVNPTNFTDINLDKNYPKKDYHRMYFGEIVSCNVKE